MKLTIGVPCYGDWKAEMAVSLIHALSLLEHEFHMSVRRGCYLHVNREEIFQEAVEAGSTHLMFVDSDMVFPPDAIAQLLAHDLDIVGGNYNTKSTPPISTVKIAGADGKFINVSQDKVPTKLFPCAAVATGFMLIRIAAVLECGMKRPLFDFGTLDGGMVGEDVNFCLKARASGLSVWCDPTVALGHMGEFRY